MISFFMHRTLVPQRCARAPARHGPDVTPASSVFVDSASAAVPVLLVGATVQSSLLGDEPMAGRCLGTWWAPPPSKRLGRAILVRRVRFPSTSAT